MEFMPAVKQCLTTKYLDFRTRAPRSEYWWFYLFYIIVLIPLTMIEAFIGTLGILSLLFLLAIFLPFLGVTVRRLHDHDRSGWWILLGLIPLIGSIVLLVWFIQKGTTGDNSFGSDPVPSSDPSLLTNQGNQPQ